MLDYRTYTFLAAYRHLSYTRAADELHISQPAVSQHIRQLEQHYRCTLFTKTGRGIEPTPAADVLYRTLDTRRNDEGRLRSELAALQQDEGGKAPLRLGCTRTIADYVAPRLLASHLARHPDERLLMYTGNTRELVSLIHRGEIDFALVEGSFDRTAFDHAVFSRERFIAVAGAPLACSRLEDLLAQRLILREPGSGTRGILERYLAIRDLAPADFRGVIELASIPAIKACVRTGAGISFLYRAAVADELARGELFDVTPPDVSFEHPFELIWERSSIYADRYRELLAEWGAAGE